MAVAENILEETDVRVIHEQARSVIEAGRRIQGICHNITRSVRAAKGVDSTPVNVNAKLDEALKIARYATMLQDLSIVRRYSEKVEVLA